MIKNMVIGFLIVLTVIGLFTADKSLEDNKALKSDIYSLKSSNKYLSSINADLIEVIRQDSLIISQKENDIVRIKSKINKIKKDEKLQVDNYISSDVDERVRIFTKYATSTN